VFAAKYLAIALAAVTAAGAFTGWRWLEAREALAVAENRLEEAVDGFNEQLRQVQQNEQIARDASNAYQIELQAVRSNADALLADNRGLRLVAYRSLQPFPTAPGRLDPAGPVEERDSGVEVDLVRLARLAERCEADAAQLDALIGWTRAQSQPKN
jgi:hypothetical protein